MSQYQFDIFIGILCLLFVWFLIGSYHLWDTRHDFARPRKHGTIQDEYRKLEEILANYYLVDEFDGRVLDDSGLTLYHVDEFGECAECQNLFHIGDQGKFVCEFCSH